MPDNHIIRFLTAGEQRLVYDFVPEDARPHLSRLSRVEVCRLMRERLVATGRVVPPDVPARP